MKKQQQLSPQDWQLLSEYLDGQLNSRDKANLEKRLGSQADLRAAYEELRMTRVTLRSVPMQRAPRNFTLTPSMVQAYRPRPSLRLVPILNFASAFAVLAVIITIAVQFIPGLTPAATSKQAAPASAAPAINQTVENPNGSAPPVIVQWGNTSNGMAYGLGGGGGGGGGDASSILTAPSSGLGAGGAGTEPGLALPPEPTPGPSAQKGLTAEQPPSAPQAPAVPMPTQAADTAATPFTGLNVTETPAPNQSSEAQPPNQPTQQVAMAPLEGSGPILGVRPPQEAESENQAELSAGAAELNQKNPSTSQNLVWIVPALLALIAAGTGLAAWIIKRKASS